MEASTLARFKADPSGGKVRRFKEFFDAAGSWRRVRRIVARVETSGEGTDVRFIVTNLGHGRKTIKAWKSHLAADRLAAPAVDVFPVHRSG